MKTTFLTLTLFAFSLSYLHFDIADVRDGQKTSADGFIRGTGEYRKDAFITTPFGMVVVNGLSHSSMASKNFAESLALSLGQFFILFQKDGIKDPSKPLLETIDAELKSYLKEHIETEYEQGIAEAYKEVVKDPEIKTDDVLRKKALDSLQTCSATISAIFWDREKGVENGVVLFQRGGSPILVFRPTAVDKEAERSTYFLAKKTDQSYGGVNGPKEYSPIPEYKLDSASDIELQSAEAGDLFLLGSEGLFEALPTSAIAFAVNLILKSHLSIFAKADEIEAQMNDFGEKLWLKLNGKYTKITKSKKKIVAPKKKKENKGFSFFCCGGDHDSEDEELEMRAGHMKRRKPGEVQEEESDEDHSDMYSKAKSDFFDCPVEEIGAEHFDSKRKENYLEKCPAGVISKHFQFSKFEVNKLRTSFRTHKISKGLKILTDKITALNQTKRINLTPFALNSYRGQNNSDFLETTIVVGFVVSREQKLDITDGENSLFTYMTNLGNAWGDFFNNLQFSIKRALLNHTKEFASKSDILHRKEFPENNLI